MTVGTAETTVVASHGAAAEGMSRMRCHGSILARLPQDLTKGAGFCAENSQCRQGDDRGRKTRRRIPLNAPCARGRTALASSSARESARPAGAYGGVPWAISTQALSTWSRRGGGAPQRPFRHRLVPRSRNRPLSALSARTPCALKGLVTGAVSHSSTERPDASLVPLRHIRRIGKAAACPWTTPSMQRKCPCEGSVAKAVAERADLSAHRSARPEKRPRQLPSRRPSVTKRPTNCNLFETKRQATASLPTPSGGQAPPAENRPAPIPTNEPLCCYSPPRAAPLPCAPAATVLRMPFLPREFGRNVIRDVFQWHKRHFRHGGWRKRVDESVIRDISGLAAWQAGCPLVACHLAWQAGRPFCRLLPSPISDLSLLLLAAWPGKQGATPRCPLAPPSLASQAALPAGLAA